MSEIFLNARGRHIGFPRRPLIMGILNINDDSFSGDGRTDLAWALQRAREIIALGADIVDVGGESARTNRPPITPEDELARIAPFIENFEKIIIGVSPRDEEQIFPPLLSVNTWRSEVAGPALELGGHLLNDMSTLPDEKNAHFCVRTGAALLIMHSIGTPKVVHTHVAYPNIMAELRRFFLEKIALAERVGVARNGIVLDPGIDFAKQASDNLRIYYELEALSEFQRPILLPISRKSVIDRVLKIANPAQRDAATAACLVAGMLRGATIFRVHNVEMAWRTVKTIYQLQNT